MVLRVQSTRIAGPTEKSRESRGGGEGPNGEILMFTNTHKLTHPFLVTQFIHSIHKLPQIGGCTEMAGYFRKRKERMSQL